MDRPVKDNNFKRLCYDICNWANLAILAETWTQARAYIFKTLDMSNKAMTYVGHKADEEERG